MFFSQVPTGRRGELAAAKRLQQMGYKIIETNYATRYGEIDIIAMDKDIMVFVEVRLRNTTDFGTPAETVSYHKQQRIKKTAAIYISRFDTSPFVRFDVVGILADTRKSRVRIKDIEVIKDAFI